MEPTECWPFLPFQLFSDPSTLTVFCVLAAELIVPWLLWLIKPMWIPLIVYWSMRFLWEIYRIIAGGCGKLTHLFG